MNRSTAMPRKPEETRQKLVAATRTLVLRRGFTGTGVEQICADAGVTKGAFFHHFASKDEIGKAVLADWAAFGMGIYSAACSEPARYPLDHVHRFFDIMIGLAHTSPVPLTCVVGMISQELAEANPVLREAASTYLGDWTDFARQLLDEAKAMQRPLNDFNSADVAWFLNSLWQGSMLVAKTRQDPQIVIKNLERARSHINGLFGPNALNNQINPNPTKP